MGQLSAELRRSLAWDQGSELAVHADIAKALSARMRLRGLHEEPIAVEALAEIVFSIVDLE